MAGRAARLEAGRAKVERAAAAVTAAYAEDDAAPGPAREELEAAEAEVIDLGRRAAAAELRAASA